MMEIFLGIALCTFVLGFALEMSPLGKLLKHYLRHKSTDTGCAHAWGLDRVTYAPPIHENGWHWLDRGQERERGVHGCTTVAELCTQCGARRETIMLGKQIPIVQAGAWTGVQPS